MSIKALHTVTNFISRYYRSGYTKQEILDLAKSRFQNNPEYTQIIICVQWGLL